MNRAALVIGYGNRLRSNDGAGARVAERLASDGVAVRVCDQLVPELADDLKGRAVVVFVDAERLYGAKPLAFLVTVGASSFALGEDLSPPVDGALPEAAALVRRLMDTAE